MNTYFGSLLSTEVLLHKAASWPWRCYSSTNVRIIYNIIMQPIVRLLERTTRYFNRNNVPEVEIRLGTNCIWSNLQHYEGGWCERSHGLYCSIMFKWLEVTALPGSRALWLNTWVVAILYYFMFYGYYFPQQINAHLMYSCTTNLRATFVFSVKGDDKMTKVWNINLHQKKKFHDKPRMFIVKCDLRASLQTYN